MDIGCGGGANIANWLGKCAAGHVTGIDYSKVSVEESKKLNAIAINQGKCDVVHGDVSSMPFDDEAFDCVSAFETVYFWKDLEKMFCRGSPRYEKRRYVPYMQRERWYKFQRRKMGKKNRRNENLQRRAVTYRTGKGGVLQY